jgi:diguanylate cyclase (GGDEF)-like protein
LSASAVLLPVLFFRAQPVGPAAAYGPVLLTFVNIIGALACFRAERGARAEFLEREVVNLIVGTDGVTGIPNRHAFDSHLRSAWRQAQRETRRVAVMLVEIDYFEAFAARHGRQVADVALRRIAHAVLSCARRPLDRAARHAQGTLALVLFDPAPKFLETVASRVRSEVALLDIGSDVPEAKGRLTVSIGVAVATARPGQADDALMTVATEALASRAPERHRLVIRLEPDPGESAILRGPWRSAPAK